MILRIPLADPPINDAEIAMLRDDIVGTAPSEAELHHIAQGVLAHSLMRFGDLLIEQAGVVLTDQVLDFARRIWCYQQIAMQLFAERHAIDFPDNTMEEVLSVLVKRSAESDYGD